MDAIWIWHRQNYVSSYRHLESLSQIANLTLRRTLAVLEKSFSCHNISYRHQHNHLWEHSHLIITSNARVNESHSSDPRLSVTLITRLLLTICFLQHGAANLANHRLKKRSPPHLGQGLVGLLWGAAVRLSDIAEGQGHVLQGKVAVCCRAKEDKEGQIERQHYPGNNKLEKLMLTRTNRKCPGHL